MSEEEVCRASAAADFFGVQHAILPTGEGPGDGRSDLPPFLAPFGIREYAALSRL
jgi:hypothetical protein